MQNRYKLVDVVRSVGEFSVCVLWGVIIFLGILSAVTVRVSWVNRLLFFLGGHWGHFQLNLHEPQSVQTTRSQQFSSLVSLKFYYLTRRSVCYHHQGNVDKAFFFLLGTILVIPFLGMFLKNGYKHGVDTNKDLETSHMIRSFSNLSKWVQSHINYDFMVPIVFGYHERERDQVIKGV